VARAELASEGIVVSTMYPFVRDTEFVESIRAGHESASQLESGRAPQPRAPEQVAEAILDLITTDAEQADLVPEQFGGGCKGLISLAEWAVARHQVRPEELVRFHIARTRVGVETSATRFKGCSTGWLSGRVLINSVPVGR